MPCFCAVLGCSQRRVKGKEQTFYRIPVVNNLNGWERRELVQKRRDLWIAALNRPELATFDEKKLSYLRICTNHFISGQKAALEDVNNPDWVPSINMNTHKISKGSHTSRKIKQEDMKSGVISDHEYVYHVDDTEFENEDENEKENETENSSLANVITCSVFNCCVTSRSHSKMKFYIIPIVHEQMPASYQQVESKRREAWLSTIPLKNSYADIDTLQICSQHFLLGEPANVLDYCHTDWVPSLQLKQIDSDDETRHPIFMFPYIPYRDNMSKWIFGDFCQKPIRYAKDSDNDTRDAEDHLDKKTIHLTINPLSTQDDEFIFDDNNISINMPKEEIQSDLDEEDFCEADNANTTENMEIINNTNDELVIKYTSINEHFCDPISCETCYHTFHDYVGFYIHLFQKNECLLSKKHCEICDKTFTDDIELKQHMKNHTHERRFTCNLCNTSAIVSTISQLDHMRTHSNKKFFICDTCGKVYLNKDELEIHVKMHDPLYKEPDEKKIAEPRRVLCDICGKTYTNIREHMRYHRCEKPFKCEECGKYFTCRSYWKKHQQSHRRKPLICGVCGKIFFWWETFCKHVATHPTENPPLECTICRRHFSHDFLLEYHKESHEVYDCKICKKSYQRQQLLTAHIEKYHSSDIMEIDTKVKKKLKTAEIIECEFCDEVFLTKAALDLHTRNHTIERLYYCDHCNEALIGTELEEIEHKASHNGHTSYICDICGKEYSSRTSYNMHIKIHPGSLPLSGTKAERTNYLMKKPVNCNETVPIFNIPRLVISPPPPPTSPSNIICDICFAKFNNFKELQRHKTIVHKKKYRCNMCGIIAADIVAHVKIHKYCKICSLQFQTKAELAEHNLEKHFEQ